MDYSYSGRFGTFLTNQESEGRKVRNTTMYSVTYYIITFYHRI